MSRGLLSANCSQELTADTNNLTESVGFLVDADGTLRCRLNGDTTTRDLPLKGGIIYPLDLVQVVFSAGTVTIAKVWLFRRGSKVTRA
jgi:hypothetical protein